MSNLKVTLFRDVRAQSGKEVDFSLDLINGKLERPDKKSLPLFKMARFGDKRSPKGAIRFDDNVIAVSGVELDYDEGKLGFREALDLLAVHGIKAFGYTSPSFTRDKPKWRIVLPFSQEYTGTTTQLKAISLGAVCEAEDILGVTFPPESKKLSQSFFFGRAMDASEYDWGEVDGEPIDVSFPDLRQRGFFESDGAEDVVTAETRMEQITTGENYHESHLALSARWAALGMERHEIEGALQGMMLQAPDAGTPRWQSRFDDIPRVVESAIQKFSRPASAFLDRPESEKTDAGTKPRIRPLASLFDFHDPVPEQVFLVDKLVPQGELALFTGAPGTGKSFTLLDIMMNCALGLPVLDTFPTVPCRVIYIGAEDDRDKVFRRRLHYWAEAKDLTDEQIETIMGNTAYFHPSTDFPGNFMFTTKDGPDPHALKWLVEQCKDFGDTSLPLLVGFDPLVSFFGGESENSSADMQALITFFRHFNAKANATTIVCHHDAKGHDAREDVGDTMGRGSSAVFGGVRSGFRLWKPDPRTLMDRLGLAVSPDDARSSYVALSQGKSNYGEFAPTIFLRRAAGGVLVPVQPVDRDAQAEMDWLSYSESILAVLAEEENGVTGRQVKENRGQVVTRMTCGEWRHAEGERLFYCLEWAANVGHIRMEEARNGGARFFCND